MTRLLHIETAITGSSFCISDNENIVVFRHNPDQKDSAAWLHQSLSDALDETDIELSSLDGIAISSGPGSYTGLRVGMAAAKGFCYTISKPLILINTLEMMAAAMIASTDEDCDIYMPMIDARRMEVFTAGYDAQLQTVVPYANRVLEAESFGNMLKEKKICFSGNGAGKFKPFANTANAVFIERTFDARDMAGLAIAKFSSGDFASLAYAEPFYGKDFHSTS